MPLLQLLGGALLTALLVTGAEFFQTAFPFLVPPLLLAVPVPAAYLHLRHGALTGGGVILAAAALLMVEGWPGALEYLVLFGPGSYLVPHLLRRRIHWDRAAAGGALATLATFAPVLFVAALLRETTPTGLIRGYLEAEVARAHQLWGEMTLPPNQVAELERLATLTLEWVPRLYPAIMALAVGTLMLVMVSVLRRLLRRQMFLPGPMFHQWKLPEPLVWVLIAAGFAAVFPFEPLKVPAYNALIVLLPLYFLQGMAVISSWMLRRGIPPFVRGLIYLLTVLLNPLPLIVTGLGIFDLWADFRKPRQKKDPDA